MGRALKVTYEQEASAAEKMISENLLPTKRKVRDILNAGSMNTISDIFDKWQVEKEGRAQNIDVLLSPTIAHAVSDTIAHRVQEACAAMTLQITNLQEELNGLVIEHMALESDLAIQNIENKELIDNNSMLIGQIKQLDEEASRIKNDLNTERSSVQMLHIKMVKSELQLETLPGLDAGINDTRLELIENRAQAAKLHEIAAVANAKLEAEVTHRKNNEAQRIEAIHQREEAEKRAFAATEAMNSERLMVQAYQLKIDASVREIAAANDSTTIARAEAKKASEYAAELRGQLASMKNRNK